MKLLSRIEYMFKTSVKKTPIFILQSQVQIFNCFSFRIFSLSCSARRLPQARRLRRVLVISLEPMRVQHDACRRGFGSLVITILTWTGRHDFDSNWSS